MGTLRIRPHLVNSDRARRSAGAVYRSAVYHPQLTTGSQLNSQLYPGRPAPQAPRWSSDLLVAYFCSEFAITEHLPIYSGGLGVLAGDHLKSASDLGLPMVALGLAHHHGYFAQTLDEAWLKAAASLPWSWFAENVYFTGHGADEHKRFDRECGLRAIEWVCEDRDAGVKGISKDYFIKDCCLAVA